MASALLTSAFLARGRYPLLAIPCSLTRAQSQSSSQVAQGDQLRVGVRVQQERESQPHVTAAAIDAPLAKLCATRVYTKTSYNVMLDSTMSCCNIATRG